MTVMSFHKFIMRHHNLNYLLSTLSLSCSLIFGLNNVAIADTVNTEDTFPVENNQQSQHPIIRNI